MGAEMDTKKEGSNMSAADKAKLLDDMNIGYSSRQVVSEEELVADYLQRKAEKHVGDGVDKAALLSGMGIAYRSRQVATEEEVAVEYLSKQVEKEALLGEMDVNFKSRQVATEDDVIAKYSAQKSAVDIPNAKKTALPESAPDNGSGANNASSPKTLTAPVAINSLNTLVIPSLYELASDFAQQQLFELASQLAEAPFIVAMAATFGTDIPAEAYQQLYRDASDKIIMNPFIYVSEDYIEGHLAGFDQSTQEILIAEPFIEQALNDNEKKAQLFAALIEEYGHYIDYLLRNTYSQVGGDAAGDEGAIFSYNLIHWNAFQKAEINFAEVKSPGYSGPLIFENTYLNQALTSVDLSHQLLDEKVGNIEFFGAGRGDERNPASYAHRSIEHVLAEVGFDPVRELPRIYFGNWLRDYSQIVDPAIVRPTGEALKKIQQDPMRAAQLDSMRLSRIALTRLVGLLAAKEFGAFDKEWAKSIYQNMTPEILGVYRPEEHIDNPKGLKDSSYIDPDFVDAPTNSQLAVNRITGLKNYIATSTPGESFPTSLDYMKSELRQAMKIGPTDDGFRHFGQALHVLEDFFSHSNYIELAIIKLGHQNKFATPELNALARTVQPRVDFKGHPDSIPLVTGRFGQFDVLASIGPKLSKVFDIKIDDYLSAKEESKAKRVETDLAILILLEDLAEAEQADTTQKNKNYCGINCADLLSNFRKFIVIREDMVRRKESMPEAALKAYYYLVKVVLAIANASIYLLTEVISHSIDDAQTLLDITGEDPTHSQLAKDHDDHPLHELAALLARIAVADVGQTLYKYWRRGDTQSDAQVVASSFIRHPKHNIVGENIIIDWVNGHYKNVEKATFPTVLHEASHHFGKAKISIESVSLEAYQQYLKVRDYFGL
jgi:hypothetical protein